MIFRNIKLNWPYALGELAIVIVGILIAVAIDQWNDNRKLRIEESVVLLSFVTDIELDLRDLEFRLDAINQKEESLGRVQSLLRSGEIEDSFEFLMDVVIGANYGWNQGRANRATYDDLIGSGRLGIIRDSSIRHKIANYYRQMSEGQNRMEERETGYPALTYELVPRSTTIREGGVVWEREVQTDLSEEELEELVQGVLLSEIDTLIIAERNFARFVRGISLSLKEQATDLAITLKQHQAGLQ